jgi:hypothetical protein
VLSDAQTCAALNTVNGQSVSLTSSNVVMGVWNQSTLTFTPGNTGANSVQVTVNATVFTWFAPVIGISTENVSASAVAAANRWDVIFAQDISSSYSTDLPTSVLGTSNALPSFAQYAPSSYIGLVQFGGWGSTWMSMTQIGSATGSGSTCATMQAKATAMADCSGGGGSSAPSPHQYNVSSNSTTLTAIPCSAWPTSSTFTFSSSLMPTTSITATSYTPNCCGSDCATGLQQAINMFTDNSTGGYLKTKFQQGTRRAIIMISDGASNPDNANAYRPPPSGLGTANGTTTFDAAQLNYIAAWTSWEGWNGGSGPDSNGGISVFVLLFNDAGTLSTDATNLTNMLQGDGVGYGLQQCTSANVSTKLNSIITSNLKYGLVQ